MKSITFNLTSLLATHLLANKLRLYVKYNFRQLPNPVEVETFYNFTARRKFFCAKNLVALGFLYLQWTVIVRYQSCLYQQRNKLYEGKIRKRIFSEDEMVPYMNICITTWKLFLQAKDIKLKIDRKPLTGLTIHFQHHSGWYRDCYIVVGSLTRQSSVEITSLQFPNCQRVGDDSRGHMLWGHLPSIIEKGIFSPPTHFWNRPACSGRRKEP